MFIYSFSCFLLLHGIWRQGLMCVFFCSALTSKHSCNHAGVVVWKFLYFGFFGFWRVPLRPRQDATERAILVHIYALVAQSGHHVASHQSAPLLACLLPRIPKSVTSHHKRHDGHAAKHAFLYVWVFEVFQLLLSDSFESFLEMPPQWSLSSYRTVGSSKFIGVSALSL